MHIEWQPTSAPNDEPSDLGPHRAEADAADMANKTLPVQQTWVVDFCEDVKNGQLETSAKTRMGASVWLHASPTPRLCSPRSARSGHPQPLEESRLGHSSPAVRTQAGMGTGLAHVDCSGRQESAPPCSGDQSRGPPQDDPSGGAGAPGPRARPREHDAPARVQPKPESWIPRIVGRHQGSGTASPSKRGPRLGQQSADDTDEVVRDARLLKSSPTRSDTVPPYLGSCRSPSASPPRTPEGMQTPISESAEPDVGEDSTAASVGDRSLRRPGSPARRLTACGVSHLRITIPRRACDVETSGNNTDSAPPALHQRAASSEIGLTTITTRSQSFCGSLDDDEWLQVGLFREEVTALGREI